MALVPVDSHPMQQNQTLDDHMDVPESGGATVSPSGVKNAEELDCEEMFKIQNYKIHMCVVITSNIVKPTVSVWEISAGPNRACMSLLPVKWRTTSCIFHHMSLDSALDSPVLFISKVYASSKAGHPPARVLFGVVDNLAVPLLLGS